MRLLLAGMALAVAGVVTWEIVQRARFDELREHAEALADTVRIQRDSLQVVMARTDVLLDAQRRELLDSISNIPRMAPTREIVTFVDTITVTEDVRAQIRAAVEPILAERDQLREVVDGIPDLLAQRDALWLERERAALATVRVQQQQITALEVALEAKPSGPGWTQRLLFAAGGAVLWELVR